MSISRRIPRRVVISTGAAAAALVTALSLGVASATSRSLANVHADRGRPLLRRRLTHRRRSGSHELRRGGAVPVLHHPPRQPRRLEPDGMERRASLGQLLRLHECRLLHRRDHPLLPVHQCRRLRQERHLCRGQQRQPLLSRDGSPPFIRTHQPGDAGDE